MVTVDLSCEVDWLHVVVVGAGAHVWAGRLNVRWHVAWDGSQHRTFRFGGSNTLYFLTQMTFGCGDGFGEVFLYELNGEAWPFSEVTGHSGHELCGLNWAEACSV
jgi:hypothetical protein